MRRNWQVLNPLYTPDADEANDEVLRRLSSIYTIDDHTNTGDEPLVEQEPSPDYVEPDPVNTLYLMPKDDPDDEAATRESRSSDLRAHTLVQVPGPEGEFSDRKLYFETVDKKSDDGPREVYVYQMQEEESEESAFDPENTLYLMPIYQTGLPITRQPLGTNQLAHTLVNISGPSGHAPDGKMYFEPVNSNADDGPHIVYVLEPPSKEDPKVPWPPPIKPQPQTTDRPKHHFWEGRQGPVEIEFSADEIRKASPNWFKIFKRAFSVGFIILELIGEFITLDNMAHHKNSDSNDADFFDTMGQVSRKTAFECDSAYATKNLIRAYTIFVSLQCLFALIRIINIVGETIDDVKGGGFQVMHGWDETALGLMLIDFPEAIILISFINQCKKTATVRWLVVTPIVSLFKNLVRKNTTRQKPSKEEVTIPLLCYSLVLIDKEGKFSCSFRPKKWKISCFRLLCWKWILYKDEGCCSDHKKFCICDPKKWHCCTLYFCCFIKIKVCSGVGCQEYSCCKVGFCNPCSLITSILKIVFLILRWVFKTLFSVFVHIFSKVSSSDRFKPVSSDNLEVLSAFNIMAIIQICSPFLGLIISYIPQIMSGLDVRKNVLLKKHVQESGDSDQQQRQRPSCWSGTQLFEKCRRSLFSRRMPYKDNQTRCGSANTNPRYYCEYCPSSSADLNPALGYTAYQDI